MVGFMYAGDVEYSREGAAVDINDLIQVLTDAKNSGVTEIVLESGNYRGPKYLCLSLDITDEDEDEDY